MTTAKYTEYFSEYLETHDLPDAFASVEGLGDLFVLHFFDREIGLETEDLFEAKLEGYADIWIPAYSQRLTDLGLARTALSEPTKVSAGSTGRKFRRGKEEISRYEYPVNGTVADPSAVEIRKKPSATDGDEETVNNGLTVTGYTPDEALRFWQAMTGELKDVLTEFFKKFEPIFMQIF